MSIFTHPPSRAGGQSFSTPPPPPPPAPPSSFSTPPHPPPGCRTTILHTPFIKTAPDFVRETGSAHHCQPLVPFPFFCSRNPTKTAQCASAQRLPRPSRNIPPPAAHTSWYFSSSAASEPFRAQLPRSKAVSLVTRPNMAHLARAPPTSPEHLT